MSEFLERNPWVWASFIGIIGVLMGAFMSWVRQGKSFAWRFAFGRFATIITVESDDPLYYWIRIWLSRHPYTKRSRTLQASSEHNNDPGAVMASAGALRVMFIPVRMTREGAEFSL